MFLSIVDLGGRSSKTPENEYRRSDNCDRHGEKSHCDKALLPGLTPVAGSEVIGEPAAVPKAAAIEVTSQFK